MTELPTGTVTFLFTDIEGSTRLLEEHGARYADMLEQHRCVLRDASSRHGGVEVDTQGDAFFVAFARAQDAVAAAQEAQRQLEIPVRMGIHTGEPQLSGAGYIGIDVNRGARICSAANGRQVVLSETTRRLLENIALLDLGEHRLKDLAQPVRLFQCGEDAFPPLRSLYRTNLPVPATPFLGRIDDVRAVTELLGRGDVRLLTLIGPGGTGKTRLALQAAAEVAERFPDGLWWVALAPLRDPGAAVAAAAQVLELARADSSAADAIVWALDNRRALLLLDNAEHLLPALAEDLARVIPARGSTVLVTSRERLQLQAEVVYDVPPLVTDDAVELFRTRARAVGSHVERSAAVEELCARLDNLPLALELAAARTPLFSPEQLLERLARALDLFKAARDADPRQQTLRATIEWSYALLEPEERRLLRGLSVFAGGCSFEAAEKVCDADPDTLQSLLDKSLLRRRDTASGPRYWLLETIRQYAIECARDAGEEEDLCRRHADWVARFVDEIGSAGELDLEAIERLDLEYGNIAAALSYAAARDAELTAVIAASAQRWWDLRGRGLELESWIDPLLDQELSLAARAKVLAARVGFGLHRNDVELMNRVGEELLAVASELDSDDLRARALACLGSAAFKSGDVERGSALERQAIELARTATPNRVPIYLGNLGWALRGAGRFDEARELLDEAIVLARHAPTHALQIILAQRANLALDEQRFEQALGFYREALERGRDWKIRGAILAVCLNGSWSALLELGHLEDAARLQAAADRLVKEFGLWDQDADSAELHDRFRDDLGAERFEALVQEGRSLSADDAIALALAASDPAKLHAPAR